MKKEFRAVLSYLISAAVRIFFLLGAVVQRPSVRARKTSAFKHLTWPSNHDPNISDLRQKARHFGRAAAAIYFVRRHIGGAEILILSSFGYRLSR